MRIFMAEKSNNKAKERWYQHRLHHKKLLRIIIFQHGIYGKEEDRRSIMKTIIHLYLFLFWSVLACVGGGLYLYLSMTEKHGSFSILSFVRE